MKTSVIVSPATLERLRERVLADAGDVDLAPLEALQALSDSELACLWYGYARAVRDAHRGGDVHAQAASYALEAIWGADVITAEASAQLRSELAAALR
ncbi:MULTISPECIES: hypothetical protein [unclassified Streptomyces]|uniref:hypothetical protein n=1 Tax=unclassified Streptomyces TaxID=2593676 RepID=UPI00339E2EBF